MAGQWAVAGGVAGKWGDYKSSHLSCQISLVGRKQAIKPLISRVCVVGSEGAFEL